MWRKRLWRREVGLFFLASCLSGGSAGALLSGIQVLLCPRVIQSLFNAIDLMGDGRGTFTTQQTAVEWITAGLLCGLLLSGIIALMLLLYLMGATRSELPIRHLFAWLPRLIAVVAVLWAASGAGMMLYSRLAPQFSPFRVLAQYPDALGVWWTVGSTLGACLGTLTAMGLGLWWCAQSVREERQRITAANPVQL